MHYKLHNLLIISTLFFLFTNCDIINPEEPIPAYLEVDSISLSHEINAIGIQDVWVDIDGNSLGVYELPAKFPVAKTGKTKVTLTPGIKVNGINEQRTYYPFYESIELNIDLKPSETVVVNQTTTYTDWTNIAYSQPFEITHDFSKYEGSDTSIYIRYEDYFEGGSCGAVYLDSINNSFIIQSPSIDIPDLSGAPGMFLELNFKTNTFVRVGYYILSGNEIITTTPIYIVQLVEKNTWTKLYIDLYNHLIKYNNSGYQYRIFMDGWIGDGKSEALFLLDDLKIIESN
ncbi:MAG: hypothetical protein JEZ09_14010 [Salinivirgaceae bacterium]|nr:hypothetical protein [Salinivirgaceae bacterium]